jgi:hypothetical protein
VAQFLATQAAGREKNIIFVGIDALPQEGQTYVKHGIASNTQLEAKRPLNLAWNFSTTKRLKKRLRSLQESLRRIISIPEASG